MGEEVTDIMKVIEQINEKEKNVMLKDKLVDKSSQLKISKDEKQVCVNNEAQRNPDDWALNVNGLYRENFEHFDITGNIRRIYKCGNNSVYLLKKENLVIQIKYGVIDSYKTSKISLMMNHKNVAKTFLAIYARKNKICIEIIVGPYYEEEVNASIFKTSADICDLYTQLASGMDYLHSQEIDHGDIYTANIRYTKYDKTINKLQKEFVEVNHAKIKSLVEEDTLNITQNKGDGLVYLAVCKSKILLDKVISVKDSYFQYEKPVYVIIDFGLSDYNGFKDSCTGLPGYKELTSHLLEARNESINRRLRNDIISFAKTIYYCSQAIIYKNNGKTFNILWEEYAKRIPKSFSTSENLVEQLLWQCAQKNSLLTFKQILDRIPSANAFEEFTKRQLDEVINPVDPMQIN